MRTVTCRLALTCVTLLLLHWSATAQAGTIVGGWNYAIDSVGDGSGGATFEYGGLAYRQASDRVYFAIEGGMPLGGTTYGGAADGRVDHGDLFLNFSSHNLDTAAEFHDPLVFAVRFAALNDSLGGANTATGLFGNVTPVSTALANAGYGTLAQYLSGHNGQPRQMGDLHTQADVLNYLGGGTIFSNILTGNFLGSITLLNQAQLVTQGLDVSQFPALSPRHVFGFSLSSALLPTGQFTAHLNYECGNDGVALQGLHAAPEPSSLALLGLGLATLCGCARRRLPLSTTA